MAAKHSDPKFKVGDRVLVNHPVSGEWEGEILWVNHVDYLSQRGWEYEVSNAPSRNGYFTGVRGYEWHPLVWEDEITELRPSDYPGGVDYYYGDGCDTVQERDEKARRVLGGDRPRLSGRDPN